MAYHDNEYKPDSPKKITAKKEELIVSPNFISTPEQNLIKQIEAEFKNIKPTVLSSKRSAFLNKVRLGGGGCGCAIVYSDTLNHEIKLISSPTATPVTLLFNGLSDYNSWSLQGWIPYPELAKSGDKIWMSAHKFGPTRRAIIEFELNSNCDEITLTKIMPFSIPPHSNSSVGAPTITAKDSTTLIGNVHISGQGWTIVEADVSGSNAVGTPLFITPGNCNVTCLYDLVYLSQSNSIIGANSSGDVLWVDYASGAIIDQQNYPGIGSAAAFCHQGKVYIDSITPNEIFEVDLSGGIIYIDTANPIIFPDFMGDAASSPECCDESGTPTGCYNIGDIGPEGGIIFSIPGVGPNTSTNMYYEVMQNDIDIGGTDVSLFNVSCDPGLAVQFVVNAEAPAHVADHSLQFSITNPVNTQFVNNINSGIIDIGTLVNSGMTPGNVLMFPTLVGNYGVPITNIIIGSSEITLEFNAVILAGYTPPLLTLVSFFNPIYIGLTIGSEWGAYNQPTTAINTLPDFGIGIDNTYIIDTFPLQNTPCPVTPTGNCHPWLDTRDIAASVCIQQPAVLDDWFLPSIMEFKEMVTQVGSLGTGQISLNSSWTQNSEHIYWTSSQYIDTTGSGLQDPDKYSWAWDADTNNFKLAWRCHPLSVRPIRRFECESCAGCDCVEYNYRDGGCGTVEGSFCSSCHDGSGGPVSATDWTTTTGGTQPGTTSMQGDSVMGGPTLHITLNSWDVISNQYTMFDFLNMGTVKISLWDVNYNFMGKWEYQLGGSSGANVVGFPGSNNPSFGSYDNPGPATRGAVYFHNPQHLEGDYPTIWYGGNGSSTGIFMKLEWSGAVSYETGCNSTIFGNPHPHNTPGTEEDWPFYCGPLYNQLTGNYTGLHRTIPRYATNQPIDLNGVTLPVYPTALLANPNYNMSLWPPIAQFSHMLGSGECADCDYDIGDVGPAGGIIVATPNMGLGTVTPNGADENLTNFYYELSPVDLNPSSGTPNTEWGNWHNLTGSGPIDLNGVVQNLIGVGEGEQNTTDLMTTNPGANCMFCNPAGPAAELCDNYSLNGYDDWFLPNILEWWFVRNNIPPISTNANPLNNLYWTSNFWSDGVINEQYGVLQGNIVLGPGPNVLGHNEAALATDVGSTVTYDPLSSTIPPLPASGLTLAPGVSSAFQTFRWDPIRVRAMRKFDCQPPLIVGCMDPQASNYNPSAVINSGCIYENHCWSICGVKAGGTWYAVPDPWFSTSNPINWGPIAMENNPLGVTTPPFSTNPPVNQDYTAFYDWIVTQIPTLAIGDTFIYSQQGLPMVFMAISATGALVLMTVNQVCYKYKGIQIWNADLQGINDGHPLPTITPSNCCVSGGSSSSIIRPTSESDPNAIKMEMRRIREDFSDDGTISDIKSLY